MSELYKVVEIEGKGKGCIATKKIKPGTIILSGKPDVTAKSVEAIKTTIFFKSLMSSFKQLNEKDQEEYLNLHNRFEGKLSVNLLPNDLFSGMNSEEFETYSEKVLKVYGIYKTNDFDDGVSIKVSRFNHSCCANASNVYDQESKMNEVRAVSKIDIGDEICINYSPRSLFMKNLQCRQKWLLTQWGFNCSCGICLDERENDSDKAYERFAKLREEQEEGDPQEFLSFTISLNKIASLKEMYKLASEKKAARSHLHIILEDGLFAATTGYIHAKKSRNTTLIEQFQKDAETFAKADAKIQKVIRKFEERRTFKK